MINIQFDIPVQISVNNYSNFNFKSSLIQDFNDSMLKNSRCNSVGEIISYELGPIKLINYNTKIKEKNILTITYQVQIIGNHCLNNDTVEEIIYCVLPSAYEEDSFIKFITDGYLRPKTIKVVFTETPKNIIFS
jgi:hypothetical protein